MADNHDDDDDLPDFLATLVKILAAKAQMAKKQMKVNSGSSDSTTNAVSKSNQKLPYAQGSSKSKSAAGCPKVRPTASKSGLSAGKSRNLKVSLQSSSSPKSSEIALPTSRDRRSIKKQIQMKARPECDLISQELTAAKGEVSKALDKQMVDLEKSFQEKAKFVVTLKTICRQMEDSIKNAMGKESGGN